MQQIARERVRKGISGCGSRERPFAHEREVMQIMLTRFAPFRTFDWAFEQAPPAMPIDAVRRDDALYVQLDLPGVDPDTIEVSVERNMLTVSAERALPESGDGQFVCRERPYGRFSRQLFLGQGLDTDRIEASYDHGVLSIVVPVAEEARPRRIAIEHGNGAQAISAEAQ